MSVLSQVFDMTKDVRILPNFILRRALVVKNVNFEPNFQLDSKCLHFAKLKPSQVQSGQKCKFWSEFKTGLKISGFCQISSFAGGVVKNVNFEPNFQPDSKCLHFAKFHPLHVQSGQNSQFCAWFWLRLKISEFYHISSFACPEWSKMSVVS